MLYILDGVPYISKIKNSQIKLPCSEKTLIEYVKIQKGFIFDGRRTNIKSKKPWVPPQM